MSDHSKSETRIRADKVTVVCVCGWKSKRVADETQATKLIDAHIAEATNGSN